MQNLLPIRPRRSLLASEKTTPEWNEVNGLFGYFFKMFIKLDFDEQYSVESITDIETTFHINFEVDFL